MPKQQLAEKYFVYASEMRQVNLQPMTFKQFKTIASIRQAVSEYRSLQQQTF